MTHSLNVVRTSPESAAAALVATWLWAELIDEPGIQVESAGDQLVTVSRITAPSDRIRTEIAGILVQPRFIGWAPE